MTIFVIPNAERNLNFSCFYKISPFGRNDGFCLLLILQEAHPFAKVVTPAKAGVQLGRNTTQLLDSGFRRNDG